MQMKKPGLTQKRPLNPHLPALAGLLALCGHSIPSQAQQSQAPATSRISQVLVYPGGATVQRSASISAGARELLIPCLPAHFELDSLQVQADEGIRIGELSVQTVERVQAPECATSPQDARIRELEDLRTTTQAESEALDLALGFLKNVGGGGGGEAGGNKPAASIAGTADALKRSGLEALQRKQQLLRRQQELDLQLAPLLAERERLQRQNPQLRSLRIQLAAGRAGELRLSYRSSRAGWTPIYRAELDSSKSQLRLERHAQVAQTSGEDWRGVQLRLSTERPSQGSGLPPPRPWTLNILPPAQAQEVQVLGTRAAAPAKALARPLLSSLGDDADMAAPLPSFDVNVFQGQFAAEFTVPGRVSISSDGQRLAFGLGSETLPAQLLLRVQPQQEARAYLLAELARPTGSWPVGALQLFRDGAFIGNSQLRLGGEERLSLFFGPDERLRVQLEPEQRGGAERGFIGSRKEQRLGRAYVLENLHTRPLQLQLLEAGPAAQHEDIQVQAEFKPQPQQSSWQKLPGVVAWQLTLAPGEKQRFSADYLISAPKDARLGGMR